MLVKMREKEVEMVVGMREKNGEFIERKRGRGGDGCGGGMVVGDDEQRC